MKKYLNLVGGALGLTLCIIGFFINMSELSYRNSFAIRVIAISMFFIGLAIALISLNYVSPDSQGQDTEH